MEKEYFIIIKIILCHQWTVDYRRKIAFNNKFKF